MKKIAVAGIGYVGLSIAVLLSQKYDVVATDISKERVDLLNARRSPIKDREIEEYLTTKKLNLTATTDMVSAYKDAEYVVVAVPTNYDAEKNFFDTSAVEAVIRTVTEYNDSAYIVIKSTIPVGYTQAIRKKFGNNRILFSPEFLRESRALYDNLYPSRIIVGTDFEDEALTCAARTFMEMLKEGALEEEVATLLMGFTEAEAVKLFSNTYLALRVSYFNELDTYAELKGLNSGQIIEGVSLDPRIGCHYNNPSFGYGGYCLPKDTKQLLANYQGVPQHLIRAIIQSNRTRKDFVADRIIEKALQLRTETETKTDEAITVGIYRLAMKQGSDNFRHSSILGVMRRLGLHGVNIIVYEPVLKDGGTIYEGQIVNDLEAFKERSEVIIANRYDEYISDCEKKVYTRDLFRRD